jgi:4-methylaminobutanoate oxidase (formaldehyde-forming)
MGPRSRELLGRVSAADLTDDAFPFSTSRSLDCGPFTVRATRLTYVGELGWELYVPSEFAAGVYDLLKAEGADLDLRDAGYYAINALRLEKGYRAFGPELGPDYSPVDAGLVFTTKLKTGIDFIGRSALEAAREAGPRRRLVSWVAQDPVAMLWGGELMVHAGRGVGQVTSAAFGTWVGACVGLAYVDPAADLEGDWAVNVGGQLVPVTVSKSAPYDPRNDRVRPPRG